MAIKLKKEEEIKSIKKEVSVENKNSNSKIETESSNNNEKDNIVKPIDIEPNRKLTRKEKRALKRKNRKPKMERFTIFSIVITIIGCVVLGSFFTLPLACTVIGVIVTLFLILICMVITAVSLGLLWFASSIRDFVGKITNVINMFFNMQDKMYPYIKGSFVYIASIGGAFAISALVLSIIGYKQHKKDERNPYKKHLIFSIIFIVIFIVFIILDLSMYFNSK